MNEQKFSMFSDAYRAGLLAVVWEDQDKPVEERRYAYGVKDVATVCDKMLRAIREKPMGVSYDSPGFVRACKILGIRPTRKAILAYISEGG